MDNLYLEIFKSLKHYQLEEKEYKKILDILIQYYSLEPYIKSFKYINLSKNEAGNYSSKKLELTINSNSTQIYSQIYDQIGLNPKLITKRDFVLYNKLNTLIHELRHAYQLKVTAEYDGTYNDIYAKIMEDSRNIQYKYYQKFERHFPFEKDAYMTSSEFIINYLKLTSNDYYLIKYYTEIYYQNILIQGYDEGNYHLGFIDFLYNVLLNKKKSLEIIKDKTKSLDVHSKLILTCSLNDNEIKEIENRKILK